MGCEIVVDFEAKGVSPYRGQIKRFASVLLDDPHNSECQFEGRLLTNKYGPIAPDYWYEAAILDVTPRWRDWIRKMSIGRGIPRFVTDNPWDWMWAAYMFDFCEMSNPFGYSCRRIGDFSAGLQKNWYRTQNWKVLRETPHNHNPLYDAIGNAEALQRLLRGELPPDEISAADKKRYY